MSGKWDDTDSEDDNVEVVEKPVILPRSRQVSVAKSLEKNAILESAVAGSGKASDASDDEESISSDLGQIDLEELIDDSGEVLRLDFDHFDASSSMKKMIGQFSWEYRNVISEFADVEIFLISVDSLVIEMLAHKYHNWTLAGQTIVLSNQIDRFLAQFERIGGRFKLVVFTDFAGVFGRDTVSAFARTSAIAHLRNGKHADKLEYFTSPVDPQWSKFLKDLTPSFLMISTDNVTKEVCAQEDLDVTKQLETIVVDALSSSLSIVPLNTIVVNFASVFAHFGHPKLTERKNWDSFIAAHWDCNYELLKIAKNPTIDASALKTPAELWAFIIKESKKKNNDLVANGGANSSLASDNYDSLCCAVLLSSLICTNRGAERVYPAERKDGKRSLDVLRDRRLLLVTATQILERMDISKIKFSLADFWDGRMVLAIFDTICAGEPILPYRTQEEFGKLFCDIGLTKSLPVDTSEKLFEPVPEAKDPLSSLPLLYKIDSRLLDKYVEEFKSIKAEKVIGDADITDYSEVLSSKHSWKFKPIEEEYAKVKAQPEAPVLANTRQQRWELKKANRSRQFLSRWYELFANTLEGRGSNLLVDFARTPKYASAIDEEEDDKKKKAGKAWAGQQKAGGKKAGKEPVKSKKDLILEANKKNKDAKVIEGERVKIKYAMGQGKSAITCLESLFSSLELPESKALCAFEITVRTYRDILQRLAGKEYIDIRRVDCVSLVGHVKNCLVKYWQHLDDKQKEQIVDVWVSLGFEAPTGTKPTAEAKLKRLDLGMNMVYYQLQYGGELIDIQSDPKKDDRVTGFSPDAWQRVMLDSVDRGHSAIIVAPTSAGKTFVSYYCIEKVLRQSDEDVVVYVSPSKALINQVCGSVYARFRNKSIGRGKALFGTLTPEYEWNALNCQVLVTVPESLEHLLLSTTPIVQEFASRIRYVVFDEVHSIGSSDEAHIWEHLLLLIRCPFLALSATIGNAEKLHEWLDNAEQAKSAGKRKVDLINYGERYSELELAILKIPKPQPIEVTEDGRLSRSSSISGEKVEGELLEQFVPYGVFMPEKLRMFGIPDDQQLTARQILQLYTTMSEVDEKTRNELEPCKYFGYKPGQNVWISRSVMRDLETKLKKRFLEWLSSDEEKMNDVLERLRNPIEKQLEYRSLPFNKDAVAEDTIVGLIDELRGKNMLPAMCFNDDRNVCEALALRLCEELESRERDFIESAEFKSQYAIKDEEKMEKLAKRKRDLADRKKKGDKDEDALPEDQENSDPLAAQRAKIANVLLRFRLRGRRGGDEDLCKVMVDRMTRGKSRENTKVLLRMFERGIGFHHAGMSMVEKGAVEVLFRAGHLAVIFTTSTLALGVNMPCKTVIFGVDTAHLTPLLYRQMSGRAGRRGFDHSGTVVFMSVPTSKIRRLLTASLSHLQGNPPFTTSFLLRLLTFVHREEVSDGAQPVFNIQQRGRTALTLLTNSFSLCTRHESQSGALQRQLRMYTAYSVQIMRHLQLLDEKCNVKNLSELATTLRFNEPGNLIFVQLLQSGAFHRLVAREKNSLSRMREVLKVLANIFTNKHMPYGFEKEDVVVDASSNCKVIMPPLPDDFKAEIDKYNAIARELYWKFTAAASGNKKLYAAPYVTSGLLSEGTTEVLSMNPLVAPVFEDYSHDASFLPVLDLDEVDHRGRKLYKNAFAIDFFEHGSRAMLQKMNRLPISHMWFDVHEFIHTLEVIVKGMSFVARTQDPVYLAINELYESYDSKFRKAFGMSSKQKDTM